MAPSGRSGSTRSPPAPVDQLPQGLDVAIEGRPPLWGKGDQGAGPTAGAFLADLGVPGLGEGRDLFGECGVGQFEALLEEAGTEPTL